MYTQPTKTQSKILTPHPKPQTPNPPQTERRTNNATPPSHRTTAHIHRGRWLLLHTIGYRRRISPQNRTWHDSLHRPAIRWEGNVRGKDILRIHRRTAIRGKGVLGKWTHFVNRKTDRIVFGSHSCKAIMKVIPSSTLLAQSSTWSIWH